MKFATEQSAFILGGNSSTLAFASSFRAEAGQISAWLVPLAWTPIGAAIGETWQKVGISSEAVGSWIDQTFPAEDDRSFVSSMRDIEMLIRVGWHAEPPTELKPDNVLNLEDLSDDLLDALAEPPAELAQCAVCRRICVRDDFVWNERRLCAWDYHAMVFGRRGPWRNEPYEERHFVTLPHPRYIAAPLLEESLVDVVASFHGLPESLVQGLVNEIIAASSSFAYLAARTGNGMNVLRERHAEGNAG